MRGKKRNKPRGACPVGPYYPVGQMGCEPARGWHEPSCRPDSRSPEPKEAA